MSKERELQLSDATIGVITALPKEYFAARGVLGCEREISIPGVAAGGMFTLTRVTSNQGGDHIVVIELLPDMGNNIAALGAAVMLGNAPNVKHIIMCGIAGAVPNVLEPDEHVRLGDIVVSDRQGVIQYDYVKESKEFKHRHPPRPPSSALIAAVRHLEVEAYGGNRPWDIVIKVFGKEHGSEWRRPAGTTDRLSDDGTTNIPHPKGAERLGGRPRVFCGPIASANVLLKNPAKRDQLRDQFGAKAVEMEGSGIGDAAWIFDVGYLVVRGTCDYCNPTKDDRWQKYAAVAAAAYTKAVIETLPVQQMHGVAGEQPTSIRSFQSTSSGGLQAADGCVQSGQDRQSLSDLAGMIGDLYMKLGEAAFVSKQSDTVKSPDEVAQAEMNGQVLLDGIRHGQELESKDVNDMADQAIVWLDEWEPYVSVKLWIDLAAIVLDVELAKVARAPAEEQPTDFSRVESLMERIKNVSVKE